MQKLGIDTIKKGLGLAFAFGKQTQTALSDKKFNLNDLFGYVDEVMQVQGVIETGGVFVAEALDVDADEQADLEKWAAASDFGISNEDAKERVVAGIAWIVATVRLYSSFRKKPGTEAPTL